MNEHNVKLMRSRTQKQELKRNVGKYIGGWWVEAEDWVGWLLLLHDGVPTSAASSAMAGPASEQRQTDAAPQAASAQAESCTPEAQRPTAGAAAWKTRRTVSTVDEAAPSTSATDPMSAQPPPTVHVAEAAPATPGAPSAVLATAAPISTVAVLDIWMCGYQKLIEEMPCEQTCAVTLHWYYVHHAEIKRTHTRMHNVCSHSFPTR